MIRQFWAEALEDPETRTKLIQCLREAVSRPKTVVPALESAARLNHEIGIGAEMPVGSITINVISPVRGERLRGEGRERHA